ncbi:hypothetical protein AAY473_030274 [Plecturocebus cupreus]
MSSKNSPALTSRSAGNTVEMGFHYVGQAGLKFLTSSDPPTLPSKTNSHSVIQTRVLGSWLTATSASGVQGTDKAMISQIKGHSCYYQLVCPLLRVLTSASVLLDSVVAVSFFLCHPGWSTMLRSWLIATSTSWVQEISPASAFQLAGITEDSFSSALRDSAPYVGFGEAAGQHLDVGGRVNLRQYHPLTACVKQRKD